jgi:hypothetical protein
MQLRATKQPNSPPIQELQIKNKNKNQWLF